MDRLAPKDTQGISKAAPEAPVRAPRSGKVKLLVESLQDDGKDILFFALWKKMVDLQIKTSPAAPNYYQQAIIEVEEFGGDVNEEAMVESAECLQVLNEMREAFNAAVLDPKTSVDTAQTTLHQRSTAPEEIMKKLVLQQNSLYEGGILGNVSVMHTRSPACSPTWLQHVSAAGETPSNAVPIAVVKECTPLDCQNVQERNCAQNLNVSGPIARVMDEEIHGNNPMVF